MTRMNCPHCITGILVVSRDIYGDYARCFSCGRSPDTETERIGALAGLAGNDVLIPGGQPPSIHSWTRAIYHRLRRNPRPRRCIWGECRTHPESSGHCCGITKAPYPYCHTHQIAYRAAFGVPPPRWKEMSLLEPYGIVRIEYILESQNLLRNRGQALAHKVLLPGRDLPLNIRDLILSLFTEDTGLKLIWFDDAVAENARRRKPAGLVAFAG